MKAQEISPLLAAHTSLTASAQAQAAKDIATAVGPRFAEMAKDAAHSASYKGGKNADNVGRLAAKGSLGVTPQACFLSLLCEASKLSKKFGVTVQVSPPEGFRVEAVAKVAKVAKVAAPVASV